MKRNKRSTELPYTCTSSGTCIDSNSRTTLVVSSVERRTQEHHTDPGFKVRTTTCFSSISNVCIPLSRAYHHASQFADSTKKKRKKKRLLSKSAARPKNRIDQGPRKPLNHRITIVITSILIAQFRQLKQN